MTCRILYGPYTLRGLRYWLAFAALACAPALAATPADGAPAAIDVRPLLEMIAVRAIEYGPLARQSAAQIEAAGFDLDEARGRRWPQIDLGLQSALSTPTAKGAAPVSRTPTTMLTATTVLVDWGRNTELIGAAELGLQAARARHDAALANIVYEACAGFVLLARQTELAALAETYVSRMAGLVGMLAQIVAVDSGRASELVQARARLLQAGSMHEIAEARVREAQLEMRKRVGEALPPLPSSPQWDLPLPDLAGAIDGVTHDAAVMAINAEIDAAQRRADAIRASGMPALNLTVSRPLSPDPHGRPSGWQVGLALSMPLGRGGSINAAVSAARERALAEAGRRDQLLLDLEHRVRIAHHEARTTAARSLSYDELSVELATVRENFFEQWLHLGRRSLLDVLNAQNEHYGNQVNAVSSRYDAYAATLKLRVSSGLLVPWLRGDAPKWQCSRFSPDLKGCTND